METLAQKIARLEAELAQLTEALPPHGLKPAHLMRIEELEEEIDRLKAEAASS